MPSAPNVSMPLGGLERASVRTRIPISFWRESFDMPNANWFQSLPLVASDAVRDGLLAETWGQLPVGYLVVNLAPAATWPHENTFSTERSEGT